MLRRHSILSILKKVSNQSNQPGRTFRKARKVVVEMCGRGESVVLGFSGGMDSVTAVTLLQQSFKRVVAVTLDTIGDEVMICRAAESAQRLGVEHIVLNVREEFSRQIINYFVDSYARGSTPAPCTVCNSTIKWHYLKRVADELGIENIATGHYFNVVEHNGYRYVSRAKDSAKDQSYYLWGLGQDVLRRVVTPMGHIIKQDIKQNFSDKSESMGICFLRGQNYRDFITRHRADVAVRGNVVNSEGAVVGLHDGVAFYTIGQKRGFELYDSMSGKSIVGICAERNELCVGGESDLLKATLEIGQCNIVDYNELLSANDVSVVVRGIGRNPAGYIQFAERTDLGVRITLSDPAWALAVGQPIVFYRQDRVIGGGFLRRSY